MANGHESTDSSMAGGPVQVRRAPGGGGARCPRRRGPLQELPVERRRAWWTDVRRQHVARPGVDLMAGGGTLVPLPPVTHGTAALP